MNVLRVIPGWLQRCSGNTCATGEGVVGVNCNERSEESMSNACYSGIIEHQVGALGEALSSLMPAVMDVIRKIATKRFVIRT